ncbi:ATP-binding protein [archaeon]|nr:MAG: ATP-binding protein [archaeon]
MRLQLDPTYSSKDIVRISVTDTGAGISVQNQKKLFGQYVQFNAAQLQQGKGSGLGLWITKSKFFCVVACGIWLSLAT